MNLPEIKPYEEQAIDTVVSVINRAKESLGLRQTLRQLARSRNELATQTKVSLNSLGAAAPLAKTSEALIADVIERKWRLTPLFMYILKYLGLSQNECSQYYYFEAIFSQPTKKYPIPQATVSVFFRVEERLIEPPELRGVPMMSFRIEGHNAEHDVRYVALPPDWILAVLQMKIKLFQRIEGIQLY